jgi:transcriptional regulator with XRE-family HTH domain
METVAKMANAREIREPRAREQDWRRWMKDIGERARRMREFVGLSQEQLAKRAGVSQGAVSRFEIGRGLNTPLLVSIKINAALASALSTVDATLLTDAARRFVESMDRLSLPNDPDATPPPGPFPLLGDPELEGVIRQCSRLPEARRRHFLSLVKALALALSE